MVLAHELDDWRSNAALTPQEIWAQCRSGELDGLTTGYAAGYVQANLVILPQKHAYDFLLFCQRNPKPCPVLDVTAPGDPEPKHVAPGADLRTDLPRYRVFRDGELVDERGGVAALWRDDFVGFLLGCSFTFEAAMADAGLPLRHAELGCNVPMYKTNIACTPSGPFAGPTVVSMRPVKRSQAQTAIDVTLPYYRTHGAPLHIGDPAAIGIADIDRPDWGDRLPIRADEVPVFWACGVTPQATMLAARPEIAISHAPGYMFVTSTKVADLLD